LLRSRCVVLALFVAIAPAILAQNRVSAPKSVITVHVRKSGLFSAFAHDHLITAPVGSGTIDPKAMTVQITVATRQMKVVDPGVSEKERAEIQATMLGPKVLNVERYPEIRFTSSRVESLGAQRYRVTGKLELHGDSRELTFEVTGGPEQYRGKTRLKQTEFGIEPVTIAGGTVKVKDELEMEFNIFGPELSSANHR
jgi:polyisoprenoid-binding protein YceI